MVLYGKVEFLTATRAADLPFAFLVGSALCNDPSGGVPGVDAMLDFIRDEIRLKVPAELERFQSEIGAPRAADVYQKAMAWVQGNLTQAAVNRVVARAVLQARRRGAPSDFEGDGDYDDWHLPQAILQLAQLVTRERGRFPGPILTTNFDPLLSLALDAVGGKPRRRIIHSDGIVHRDAEDDPGITEVVYLHGYWRGSDTLHTPTQLTGPRPRLKASLQALLRQRNLIVVGYGGWDDVFTRALAELFQDDEAKATICWCFHEGDDAIVEARYGKLLEQVQPAITRGHFVAYGGIDCHSIFGEIAGLSPTAMAAAISTSPVAGWDPVDATYLASLPPLRPEELVRYFDGAVPTWRHAVSDGIPRLALASVISQRLGTLDTDASRLQLIRAAGGEGKSTVMLQVAADAAGSGEWKVLWRPSPDLGLPAERVGMLDETARWLIVADEAENLVADLMAAARRLQADGRTNVFFLLAARDADWRAAAGDKLPWEEWLRREDDVLLGRITANDAEALVDAWERCGAAGLRELAGLPTAHERIDALQVAVRDAPRSRGDGSLFGGLLKVRFGQAGLHAHVREFLNRLKAISIEDSEYTLFDALLYGAACHGTGIDGIDEKVLADLMGVPRHWVQRRIVRPLGAEAVAVRSAGQVLTRHSKVAAAILVEAERSFGVDLAEEWSRIVRQTVTSGKDTRFDPQFYSRVVHAGPWIAADLPAELSDDLRAAVAIAAAKAATEALPGRLDCVVDVCKAYRLAGQLTEAVRVCRENFHQASAKVDYWDVIRGFVYEWGVCEGESGSKREHALANAWLGGLSLSDHFNPARITRQDVKLTCAGLGVGFGRLIQQGEDRYAKGRRAAAYVGRLTNPDPTAVSYFRRYDRAADTIGTPRPRDLAEALDWLGSGIASAGRELKDPLLTGIVAPNAFSLGTLKLRPA